MGGENTEAQVTRGFAGWEGWGTVQDQWKEGKGYPVWWDDEEEEAECLRSRVGQGLDYLSALGVGSLPT